MERCDRIGVAEEEREEQQDQVRRGERERRRGADAWGRADCLAQHACRWQKLNCRKTGGERDHGWRQPHGLPHRASFAQANEAPERNCAAAEDEEGKEDHEEGENPCRRREYEFDSPRNRERG